jgi:hypothetical protein
MAGHGSVLAADGTISTMLSPVGPVVTGATFSVTLSLSGYTSPTEVDGYNFRVSYDTTLFTLVGGSLVLNDAAGPSQNWLRLAPQDGVGAGAIGLTDSTATSLGIVDISVSDLRLSSTRGTTAAAGFLYAFDLMAMAVGTGAITPSAGAGGTVFFDTSLSPSAVPAFSGASMTVVPEAGTIALLVPGLVALWVLRLRRCR